MNKIEIEKMFNNKFNLGRIDIYNEKGQAIGYENNNKEVIKFIFEIIIPEVLNSVIPEEMENPKYIEGHGYNGAIEQTKQKAKELYGIDL